ncbi:microsomal signal peptidase subunit (gp23), putative [Paecilomyces variotii No. 5]|uniref:Signal peptidase subunit 3 n=1 Tax=Byssochlamys spectabilis (strain No. 5 / NBRC 109023) TaxID=1356009 RepID=V5G7J3_BYSSN|nr:microsomal signal peptidase subunit (gp23), putative [Paecilomyces variotii No. 5]
MHSTINRAQAVFGFFTTVALTVAAAIALSVLLYPADDVTSNVELKNVQVIRGRPHYYSSKKEEYARISFDLDADLSPLFNWNTKQLFVYVLASYSSSDASPSSSLTTSESIIWDKIIPAPESPYSPSVLKERFFPAKSTSKSKSRRQSSSAKQTQKKGEGKPGVLKLKNQKPKYQITDITGKMAERQNVTLTVGWNVQPWVGALWWSPGTGAIPHTSGQTGKTKAFDLPPLKGARQEGANSDAAKTKAKA